MIYELFVFHAILWKLLFDLLEPVRVGLVAGAAEAEVPVGLGFKGHARQHLNEWKDQQMKCKKNNSHIRVLCTKIF